MRFLVPGAVDAAASTDVLTAAELQNCNAGQNENHGRVANGMNGVTHQKDTDPEGYDGRDVGHTGGGDRTEVCNDEVVDDVRETGPKQPKTNNQTCPGTRIGEYGLDPLETG